MVGVSAEIGGDMLDDARNMAGRLVGEVLQGSWRWNLLDFEAGWGGCIHHRGGGENRVTSKSLRFPPVIDTQVVGAVVFPGFIKRVFRVQNRRLGDLDRSRRRGEDDGSVIAGGRGEVGEASGWRGSR